MKDILQKLKNGEISVESAEKMLRNDHIVELEDFAKMDIHRELRTGIPEAVFAEGKDDAELLKIIKSSSNNGIIVTRLTNKRYQQMEEGINQVLTPNMAIEYNQKARILVIRTQEVKKIGKIGLITAGTSDIPVAEETRIVAEESGCEVLKSYDVGVAGIHRLFSQIRLMLDADVEVIVVVAGMEGALPSVVAGLVDVPVVGVPTSVGYGVGEGGFTALYAMLQSCAPGIAVVNIDNGFGAAIFASKIIKSRKRS
ncbi:1-(5-phosphoribosyl)-5-amino-4-imidazole-carboxylate (AIR) carboxylase [Methanobacterium lacus]|jgi:pyridinium-3,5-biscarboxylic acid mononucleotide synthase|uniref:1-(5-phosphoribosyl)-5-amino-4-imidazole-carboxylate (AIR) carboxylase n=1 Tax=Methanobacterium lacus (strain AL-21) TaxID=877455 RepID=F0T6J9_METLA|nr:nickel pincer cofactor biosynthesis protein LarB [Methanobacterium lacus]ADZ10633.1 1-(5-phosphoribosyl)-5-amino-4-imidazole-carboxylate (AIR) carboxylase [Methanobacterium lacus]